VFVVLVVAANICYLASSVVGAVALILVGFVIEIASWIVLSANGDGESHPPDSLK
jgi:hypothetical protein